MSLSRSTDFRLDSIPFEYKTVLPDKRIILRGSVQDGVSVTVARTAVRDKGDKIHSGPLFDSFRIEALPTEMSRELIQQLRSADQPVDFDTLVEALQAARKYTETGEVNGSFFRPERGERKETRQLTEEEFADDGLLFRFHQNAQPGGLFEYLEKLDRQELTVSSLPESADDLYLRLEFPRVLTDRDAPGEISVTLAEDDVLHGSWITHGSSNVEMGRIFEKLYTEGVSAAKHHVDQRVVRNDSGFALEDIYRPTKGTTEVYRLIHEDGRERIRFSLYPGFPPLDFGVVVPAVDRTAAGEAWSLIPTVIDRWKPWEKKIEAIEQFALKAYPMQYFGIEGNTEVNTLVEDLPQHLRDALIRDGRHSLEPNPLRISVKEHYLATLNGYQCLEFFVRGLDSPAEPNSLVLMLDNECEGMICFTHYPHANRTMFRFRGTDLSLEERRALLTELIDDFVTTDSFELVKELYTPSRWDHFTHSSGDDRNSGAIPKFSSYSPFESSQWQLEQMYYCAWNMFRRQTGLRKEVEGLDVEPQKVQIRLHTEPPAGFSDPELRDDPHVHVVLRDDKDLAITAYLRFDDQQRQAPYISSLRFDFKRDQWTEQYTFNERSVSDHYSVIGDLMHSLYLTEIKRFRDKLPIIGAKGSSFVPLRRFKQFERSRFRLLIEEYADDRGAL